MLLKKIVCHLTSSLWVLLPKSGGASSPSRAAAAFCSFRDPFNRKKVHFFDCFLRRKFPN